ncbi:MFS general substrate transporter [Lepidopterella palustris CBS 459.81]|uniref:MFS general substrate transporter n=1 Tax=Lepidopterella palustris CBS 459.81 TaxID=1314670 RepID=A0A8E2E447_9PEZI|nr:MFS general substrate transporter [Lepidopterella palustris CBS 459.81]
MAALQDKDETKASSLADVSTGNGSSTPPADLHAPSDEKQLSEEPEPPARPDYLHGWKWALCIAAIVSSTFLYALDGTIIAVLQPQLIEEFGHIEDLAWLSVAFLLCATATNMGWGQFYGNFNAKWFYLFHIFVFEVGSAICGAAPSMNVLILGRVIAGIGGAGQYIGCMTIISTTTTMSERPVYISLTGFGWGLGTVLGPVIGGAFAQSSAGWRWSFYINLLIGAIYAPAWFFLIPNDRDPRPGTSLRARAAEIDYAGIVLQSAALVSLFLALNLGGVTLPWDSGRIIAMFVVAGVLAIALGVQQVFNLLTTEARRLLPVQFFKDRTVSILLACTAAASALINIPTFMIPLFFQLTRGDSPLDAGVRLLPFIVCMIVFFIVNGAFMSKLGYYQPWFLVGGCIVIVAASLMAFTVDQYTSVSRVYGFTVLIGAGTGMFAQAGFAIAQAVVPVDKIAPAIGIIGLAQFFGTTLFLALANSILLNDSQSKIQSILPYLSVDEIHQAILGTRSDIVKSLDSDLQSRVLAAIVGAIGKTYILVLVGGAIAAILSLAMRREKLFQGGASAPVAAMG